MAFVGDGAVRYRAAIDDVVGGARPIVEPPPALAPALARDRPPARAPAGTPARRTPCSHSTCAGPTPSSSAASAGLERMSADRSSGSSTPADLDARARDRRGVVQQPDDARVVRERAAAARRLLRLRRCGRRSSPSPASARSGKSSIRFTSTIWRFGPSCARRGLGTLLLARVLDEATRHGRAARDARSAALERRGAAALRTRRIRAGRRPHRATTPTRSRTP